MYSEYAHLHTGRETHTAYYCTCGWRSEALKGGWAMRPYCPQCGKTGLHFVKFEEHELPLAEKIAGGRLRVE